MTKQIDTQKYIEFVNAVTSEESKYGGHFQDRLRDLNSKEFKTHRALTAALGLCAESGEFTEIVKKIVFQGKPELGDIMWYLIQACILLDTTPEEIIEMNVEKLKSRYPGGEFDVHFSENRKEGDV
jgi:NTP pyrophosphatase (non-canonical NTP hydrolase)